MSVDIWGGGKERHRWSTVNQASVDGASEEDIKIPIETWTRLLSVSDASKDVTKSAVTLPFDSFLTPNWYLHGRRRMYGI